MIRVSRVLPESIADEIGIVPLTELHSVNGRELLAEVKACVKRLERHRPASPGARA